MLQEQKCYFHDPMTLLTDFYKKISHVLHELVLDT
jgi:hypothetical protein